MSDALEILRSARAVLVIDWPSPEVPDSLARAGYQVFVKGGPGPTDYATRELRDGELVRTELGHAPEQIDIVYSYRPLSELPGHVEIAREHGARAVWREPGDSDESGRAREIVEAAGLQYVDDVSIADAVEQLVGEGEYTFPTYDTGVPRVDLTKALQLAADLEDQEIIRKMMLRK
jgi:predicted CoA-binding protein